MNVWYEMIPLDTLFFRGSTPMEAGTEISSSLFPPPVSVVVGALRSAVIRQQGVSFNDYCRGKAPEIDQLIGPVGCNNASFEITGIFVRYKGRLFFPAPATWFIQSKEKPQKHEEYVGKDLKSAIVPIKEFASLDIESSIEHVPFVVTHEDSPFSLAGIWLSTDLLASNPSQFKQDDFLLNSEIYSLESRTGIGIGKQRMVEEGKLYSSSHIRLNLGVSLVISISKDIGLKQDGVIAFGGEKRVSRYEKIDFELRKASEVEDYVSFVPIVATKERLEVLKASGKIQELAGWDASKGFHKNSEAWLPAGAVFTKSIGKGCFPLPKIK